MRILNLYAGIGGNRKLWGDEHEVTAIENNKEIAKIYMDLFPKDFVIITDAHEYLLNNYMNFDFIWSSPPCPSHSDIRRCASHRGQNEPLYPDMKLYEEIIFLQNFAKPKTKWVVENVVPYYPPLIKPFIVQRHCFWSNFVITKTRKEGKRIHNNIVGSETVYGFNISKEDVENKRKILRNMVDPKLGFHIFKMAFKEVQKTIAKDETSAQGGESK